LLKYFYKYLHTIKNVKTTYNIANKPEIILSAILNISVLSETVTKINN